MTTGDLIAELAARSPKLGGNDAGWPGLTIYRFVEPTQPQWEEIQSLSLGIVAQGRKAVIIDGKTYRYDPFNYLILSSHLHFQAQILEATPRKPFLSFVLQIDPAVVKKVSADMLEHRSVVAFPPERVARIHQDKGMVSALDPEMMGAVLRFLQSLGTGADRRVLTPMYLQEIVYRVLQREQYARMLQIAAKQSGQNPVSAALTYMKEHYAEQITVNDMAEQVCLSPSSFSHLFREITDRSPYQFLKELRLDQARQLLLDGRLSVTDVSRAVGYSSTSHFIKEFRTRFGTTPRAYVDAETLGVQLDALRGGAS
ncbi:AraC family transcriptional regulator N-terminal domain-containing protein [Kribbella sp. GL6]|uniref:AraC family transcriptional regulator n=1 Tax=Kribbella sp. GL6 TaxID=3419765 RepID=UPI003CFC7911